MENLFLRNITDDDDVFLQEVFWEARSQEFEQMNLPTDALNALLSMQYNVQKDLYNRLYPNAESFIIEFEQSKIGRLLINREAKNTHLIDISILHNFRKHGIGSFLLEKLKSEAESVSLKVFKLNYDAIRLYEKKGFLLKEEDGMYLKMEWENVG